jgi:hypothetical protein
VSLSFSPVGITGAAFNTSQSQSASTTYQGASVVAGGALTVTAGRDMTVAGATLSGDTTVVDVGRNLDIRSLQDTNRASSSSFGINLSLDPAKSLTGGGVNTANSQANGAWTNTLGTIGSLFDTHVTVAGNTTLIGGAIQSDLGTTTLQTGTLTAVNLTDSQTSSSSSFGLTLSGLGQSGATGNGYVSPFKGSVSFGTTSADKQGVTYSQFGPGTITLTGPSADTSVLATLKRTQDNRQVVTVNTSDGFSVDIPLVDFDELGRQAKNIASLITAVTAPVPADVAGQGKEAEDYYRRLLVASPLEVVRTEVWF